MQATKNMQKMRERKRGKKRESKDREIRQTQNKQAAWLEIWDMSTETIVQYILLHRAEW